MAIPVRNPATISKPAITTSPSAGVLPPPSATTPPAVIIMGEVGSGKTDALLSCIAQGKELFVLVTEPTGVEVLLDGMRRRKLPLEKLHWKLVRPARASMASLIASAKLSNTKSAGDLQSLDVGLDRSSYKQFMELLTSIADFRCDRTGESYGDVTEWDDSRVFAIDSLSGLSQMAIKHVSGNRGTITQPEYGIIQTAIYDLLTTLTGLSCFFVLTAHVEFEKDELSGKLLKSVSTVGKKLAPKVPLFFSEVVRQRREGTKKFTWSTDDADTTLKCRALPYGADLPADLAPIIRAYEARKLQVMEIRDTETTEV